MHAPAGKYCTRGHGSVVSATKVRVRLLTDGLVRAGPEQYLLFHRALVSRITAACATLDIDTQLCLCWVLHGADRGLDARDHAPPGGLGSHRKLTGSADRRCLHTWGVCLLGASCTCGHAVLTTRRGLLTGRGLGIYCHL